MRDRYLYRAKRKNWRELPKEKWWIEGYYAYFKQNNNHCIYYEVKGHTLVCDIDASTLCMCTGINDKNGRLIWENDIVDGRIKRGAAFYQCKVLWNECKARFDVKAMECTFPMTLDECTDDISVCGLDYEVIGNCFDNPELLETR